MSARLARPTDRSFLADLLARAGRRQGAVAAEEQGVLLNSGTSVLAFSGDTAVGFLGLRLRERIEGDAENWADAGMMVVANGFSTETVLATLLKAAQPGLRSRRATGVLCLTGYGWLHEALAQIGFREVDQVITYARSNRLPVPSVNQVAAIRPAGPSEADTILALNAAAFDALWRYDTATMLSWLLTAEHAVIAETNGNAVGFSLTSRAAHHGYDQLIRLATRPEVRSRGIGRQLLADSIAFSSANDAPGLALNTQASNAASRHLYEAFDFHVVGSPVMVMTYRLAR